MPSERVRRKIDQLLNEAEQAIDGRNWALVEDVVRQVLRLDPQNSDALDYLAAAERGPTKLPGEVRAAPAAQQQATVPEPTSSVPASFASGRYTVKRFLGEGGKKRVYLAHDTTLDRDVAFALIKTEGLDDTARERIACEAQAMGKLGTHPHIVTVFDLGTELPLPLGEGGGEGTPYMVTELMGGGDVEALIERARDDPAVGARHAVPLPTVLAIAEQVCQGLEFAHGKGIVHRDLKPGNVWLTEGIGNRGQGTVGREAAVPLSLAGEGQGEGETRVPASAQALGTPVAKIGDFGLAVAIDRTRLTQAGMMVGTVSYMPPEQAMGGEVTPRSDLYSLGAMLYELVTGRPPFVGDEAVAIIGQHLNTPPVAPTWHRPDCPPGLEALILRLLEKDSALRPESASEVRVALGHIAQAELHPSLPASLPQGERGDGSPPSPLILSLSKEGEGLGMRGDNPLYRRVFVGREQEVRQLQSPFDAALSGKGWLAMVVGEPGIGKTAVCEQLATYVTLRGGTTLTGHCYEEGSLSLPYLAFVEALRSYATSRPPEALRQELGSAASDVARIVSEVRERLSVEPRPPGEPEEDRWRLLQAVTGFLRGASAVQPLLLVLEDLHWADQGTLDLLVHLARNLQGARLLVIGTYRDVEVDRSHPLSATLAELRRGQEFGRVLLRGLGTPEVQRMLVAITGAEVPGSLAESIHRQTEGNPLFVQEVVRFLVEEGHLRAVSGQPSAVSSPSDPAHPEPVEGRAGALASLSSIAIPEGLRDVIGRRLSRLSPNCNRVLAVAAVIGRDFGLETLHAVVELDEEQVVSSLEEALKIGVLEESASGRPGFDLRYRFAHAFFRQTLYEELIAPRRLRLHQQVASALETQYKNRLEEHAAELAEHFAQSTDRDDLAKAVHYGELAARRAMGVYAYGEAARHLQQALDVREVLDPDETAKRCDLLLALAEAQLPAGEPERVFETIAPQALALAEALEDNGRASRTCQLAIEALTRYGNLPMSGTGVYREWAERANRYAAAATIARVNADLSLAMVRVEDGRLTEVLALRESALALARQLGDPDTFFLAAYMFVVCMWQVPAGQSSPESVRSVADELSRYPREGGRARTLGAALYYSGYVYLSTGDLTQAEIVRQELADLAQRTKDTDVSLMCLSNDIDRAMPDGELEAAATAAAHVRSRGDELGAPVTGRQWGIRGFRPLLYLNRALETLDAMPEPRQPAGQANEQGYSAWRGRARRALALAYLGRSDEAQAAMNQLLGEMRVASEDHVMSTPHGVDLLETAVLLKDREAAALVARRLQPVASLAYGGIALTCVARHLGAAAALLGQRDEARAYYEQALDVAGKIRFRPEVALTHLGIAELLLDDADGDHRVEALVHLDFAIGEFQEMKMQPALERALSHKAVLKA